MDGSCTAERAQAMPPPRCTKTHGRVKLHQERVVLGDGLVKVIVRQNEDILFLLNLRGDTHTGTNQAVDHTHMLQGSPAFAVFTCTEPATGQSRTSARANAATSANATNAIEVRIVAGGQVLASRLSTSWLCSSCLSSCRAHHTPLRDASRKLLALLLLLANRSTFPVRPNCFSHEGCACCVGQNI